jgi:flagellar hook-length control protein FliK
VLSDLAATANSSSNGVAGAAGTSDATSGPGQPDVAQTAALQTAALTTAAGPSRAPNSLGAGAGNAAAPSDVTAAANTLGPVGAAAATDGSQTGASQTGASQTDAAAAIAAAGGAKASNPAANADAQVTADASSAADVPDAATALGAAAVAMAAAAASNARAITDLATTAADKHSRTVDAAAGAASPTDATAGAAQGMTGTSSSAAAAAPTFKVGASVGSSEFAQGVADQVAAMVSGNLSSAKLSVNPPALGPIELRVDVQGDHAQVLMMSHSTVTRDALQAGTQKLREMLSEQGFAQVSVDISQRSFQDRTPSTQSYEWNSGADRKDFTAVTGVSSVTRAASGILDAYA